MTPFGRGRDGSAHAYDTVMLLAPAIDRVGTDRKAVRDYVASIGDGAAVLLHPDANEQGFTLHTAGRRRRTPIDFDGLTLIALNPAEPDNESVNP